MSTRRQWASQSAAIALAVLIAASMAIAQDPHEPEVIHISPGEDASVVQADISADGRWIVYSEVESESSASIWAIRTAGGEPVQLTTGRYWDDSPAWSPSGDRIFFRSNRPARAGDSEHYGMVLGFDPGSGRVTAQARQVTIDPVSGAWHGFKPSPDGRSLAYRTADNTKIQVIPASGGNARTVAELDDRVFNLTWSTDGRHLLFTTRPGNMTERIAFRVPAEGGQVQEIFRTDRQVPVFGPLGPDGASFVAVAPGGSPRQRTIELVRSDGRVLARHVGDGNMRPTNFSPDGSRLVGTSTRVTAPIRVVPVTGGRPVSITSGAEYDWPGLWSADGSEIMVYTAIDDSPAVTAALRGGGASRSEPVILPQEEDGQPVNSWMADENHVLYWVRIPGTERLRLVAINRRDGSREVLTENLRRTVGAPVTGPGGPYQYLGDGWFLAIETRDQQVAVRALKPDETPRLIRSFPEDVGSRTTFAVHGDRIAWFEAAGESVDLMVSASPTAQPQRLITQPAGNRCCRFNITFSNDGRRLLTEYRDDSPDAGRMLLLDLAEDGQSVRSQRVIDTGAMYWYEAQWLPDDSAVAILAGYEGLRTHVLLVPLRNGESPVMVTRDDPSPKWGFVLSPDGRYVAYPGEVWHGGSIWIMNLEPVARTARREP